MVSEFVRWFTQFFTGRPHFIVGHPSAPYLLRWYLIPRNAWLNVYLHKFLRDDDDRALHDHPWAFVSIMLRGGYIEMTDAHPGRHGVRGFCACAFCIVRSVRRAPSIAFRKATHTHRVILFDDGFGKRRPCWTVVVTGPKLREWGFYCPKGWVPWTKFVADNPGEIGKGCEQ